MPPPNGRLRKRQQRKRENPTLPQEEERTNDEDGEEDQISLTEVILPRTLLPLPPKERRIPRNLLPNPLHNDLVPHNNPPSGSSANKMLIKNDWNSSVGKRKSERYNGNEKEKKGF